MMAVRIAAATGSIIRAQTGRHAAADFVTVDDRDATDADRDRVHVGRQQRPNGAGVSAAGQRDDQVAAIAGQLGSSVGIVEMDARLGQPGIRSRLTMALATANSSPLLPGIRVIVRKRSRAALASTSIFFTDTLHSVQADKCFGEMPGQL
jgi:hypothetical protein